MEYYIELNRVFPLPVLDFFRLKNRDHASAIDFDSSERRTLLLKMFIFFRGRITITVIATCPKTRKQLIYLEPVALYADFCKKISHFIKKKKTLTFFKFSLIFKWWFGS